jgi:hypothetical protein
MFREEWRLERGDAPLNASPSSMKTRPNQFLAPEFELFRQLFEATALPPSLPIPANSPATASACCTDGQPVDLIYNRLTDFSLDATVNADFGQFSMPAVWSDAASARPCAVCRQAQPDAALRRGALIALGVPEATRKTCSPAFRAPVAVTAEQGERFWAERKRWFFKPPAGFGSRAAYRGDKLTKRVFEEILHGGYIAQEIAPPSEHVVRRGEADDEGRHPLLRLQRPHPVVAARLYQGQTTNFRTPGGGFAPVFVA